MSKRSRIERRRQRNIALQSPSKRKFILATSITGAGLLIGGGIALDYALRPKEVGRDYTVETRINAPSELSNENTINTLVDLEYKYLGLSESEVRTARDKLNGIYRQVTREIGARVTLETFLRANYNALKQHGIEYGTDTALVPELAKGKSFIDCDLMSLIYFGNAQELGFPVSLISAPGHVALGIGKINFDPTAGSFESGFVTNEQYKEFFALAHLKADIDEPFPIRPITDHQIAEGIYLRPLSKNEIIALIYNHISHRLIANGKKDFKTLMPLYEKMLELAPNNENYIGGKALNLRDKQETVSYLESEIIKHPDYAVLRRLIGITLQAANSDALEQASAYLNPDENSRLRAVYEKAGQHLIRAWELSPTDRQIIYDVQSFKRLYDSFNRLTALAKQNPSDFVKAFEAKK